MSATAESAGDRTPGRRPSGAADGHGGLHEGYAHSLRRAVDGPRLADAGGGAAGAYDGADGLDELAPCRFEEVDLVLDGEDGGAGRGQAEGGVAARAVEDGGDGRGVDEAVLLRRLRTD